MPRAIPVGALIKTLNGLFSIRFYLFTFDTELYLVACLKKYRKINKIKTIISYFIFTSI